MSRRSRASGPAISLFSFQDIITSVTAILILMVLILTLELIARLQKAGASAADVRTAADLRSVVNDLERAIKKLEEDLAERTRRAGMIAELSSEELRASIEASGEAAAKLQDTIATLDRDLEKASIERRSAESKLVEIVKQRPETDALKQKAGDLSDSAAELAEVNQVEAERLQNLEDRQGTRERSPSTLVFNSPPGVGPQPRLIDLSAAGVRVLGNRIGGDLTFDWPVLGLPPGFVNWLAALDGQREYVVVILRPSGLPHYDDVCAAIAEGNVGIGTELISESMTVVVKD